jgi:hypothetical protein
MLVVIAFAHGEPPSFVVIAILLLHENKFVLECSRYEADF